MSKGLQSAAIAAGSLRFDFEQFEEELRALGDVIESLRLKVDG